MQECVGFLPSKWSDLNAAILGACIRTSTDDNIFVPVDGVDGVSTPPRWQVWNCAGHLTFGGGYHLHPALCSHIIILIFIFEIFVVSELGPSRYHYGGKLFDGYNRI